MEGVLPSRLWQPDRSSPLFLAAITLFSYCFILFYFGFFGAIVLCSGLLFFTFTML